MDYITTQLNGVVTEADYGSTQSRINTISYTDVTAGDWYANAVTYVTLTGLMNGVGDAFQPNTNLTRAMMVTVLYRMAGEPQVTQANPFQDVAADTWYTNAVIWASETGIHRRHRDHLRPRQGSHPGAAGRLLLSLRPV